MGTRGEQPDRRTPSPNHLPNAPLLEPLERRLLLHACDVAANEFAHQWIAQQAALLYESQFDGAQITDPLYLGTIDDSDNDGGQALPTTVTAAHWSGDDLLEGTYEEDTSGVWMQHFLAGSTDLETGLAFEFGDSLVFMIIAGISQGDLADPTQPQTYYSVYEVATDHFAAATSDYQLGQYGDAYYRLGRAAHLVADVTIPAHVHLDRHPSRDTYEVEVASAAPYDGVQVSFADYAWDSSEVIGAIRQYPMLYDLFAETVDYTEDYDSNDVSGDKGTPEAFASTRLADLGLTSRHNPDMVDRDPGGDGDPINGTELTYLADDLMPWAIEQTAALFRLFYSVVDSASPPVVTIDGMSTDEANPVMRDPSFTVQATASDPVSGIDRDGYRFVTWQWGGSSWGSQTDWGACDGADVIGSFADGRYRIEATVNNGAGDTGSSGHYYFDVALAPGDADFDGDVDLDDFVILKSHFGTTSGATVAEGNFDDDGDVDLDDFVILKASFGASLPPAATAAFGATADLLASEPAPVAAAYESRRPRWAKRARPPAAVESITLRGSRRPDLQVDLLAATRVLDPAGQR